MDYCLIVILIAIPVTLATIIIFIKINKIEKKINKLHNKKREEIKTAKESPTFSWLEYDKLKLNEKEILDRKIEYYDLQIEGLEKKRRFLLDKLPFLKK